MIPAKHHLQFLVLLPMLVSWMVPDLTSQADNNSALPANPRDLEFPALVYDPPNASKYRHQLSNGVVAYLAEDHDLPLVNVSVLIRAGSYLDPKGKEGLAAMMGHQMRAGGTTHLSASQFDEEAAFLAAEISSGAGDTQGSANLNCLSKDIARGMELLVDMLKNPAFQPDRLQLYKNQTLQALERRNDQTSSIQGREWARLMRGGNHFLTAWTTKASIDSISREDLLMFHKRCVHPGNLMLAISGDFTTADMLARIEKALAGWPSSKEKVPPVPKPNFIPVPGVYVVNKPDVNQGRVSIGHLGTLRDNPDFYALSIMDDVLGGSGFTSRLVSRVRSDEGLAYSVGSDFGFGVYFEGLFQSSFQSKSATVAQATAIVLEEIERIRKEKVSPEELETAINYRVEVFPRYFATAAAIASTFAQDEFTQRKPGFWDTYRQRIRSVTAEDVLRVAQQYLHPDKLVILAVGNVDDMLKGDPDKLQYSLAKFVGDGKIHRIPLPDPVTMVYPNE